MLTHWMVLLSASTIATAQAAPVSTGTPRGYYAAPNGSRNGNGSRSRPWDLATALQARLEPGDTVWVRAGVYRGAFRATVAGRAAAPVVVRNYPGERAIIDGAGSTSSTLNVTGDYSVFWGLELTNSNPTRITATTAELRPDVVVNKASHTKYLNLIIHDGGVGFYNEPASLDVEIAGCIIYNNGWQGPDRGHGHGLYLKSLIGPLVARDNVLFNQYGYGIHAYTNAQTGKLMNITLDGNIAFDNGTLATRRTLSSNILLGGADYAAGDMVRNNVTYYAPSLAGAGANVMIGYRTLRNGDVIVENNYFVGGDPVLDFGFWSAARVSQNTLISVGVGSRIAKRDPAATAAGQIWRDNVERSVLPARAVFVRSNLYEPGRAHVVVFNGAGAQSAEVDVSGVLTAGDRYEVRNVQDLFGAPVARGTVSGKTIQIPLAGVNAPPPVGVPVSPAPRTGPAFDVFLVTKVL
jgi:hypothetical protein